MDSVQVVLGIDIGGTNTVFGLVNKNGRCFYKNQIPTEANLPAENLFARLFNTFNSEVLLKRENYELVGIGIGAPSANIYRGSIENPSNFNWGYVDAVKMVEQYYALPVLVTNDANVAAVGEMMYGRAKNMDNFILITLGTGLGSGIVVNRKILYGKDGFAGELGHVIAEENGRYCNCGRRGCLETYASATGICRTVFEFLSMYNDESTLRDYSFNQLTSKHIFNAALKGDKIALLAFEYTGAKLGIALANSVAHLNPEAIIIFGGLARSGDLIIGSMKDNLEKNLLPVYKNSVEILTSGLMESENAAILGAAALIWKEIIKSESIVQELKKIGIKTN
ncbi:MAG: ROK family protein [Ignavibacteriales bacterium]|nr:MAG: ROK family protein [Ignavibacteriales bacterium]